MTLTLSRPNLIRRIAPKVYTYDDYLHLPDDGYRYEIIEGELYVANAPSLDHQFACMEIAFHMKRHADISKLGYVITAPFEVHLSDVTRPVQPDVLFIRTDRWPGARAKFFRGAPDIVVEVVSPSSHRLDRQIKFAAYEKAGVPEYWIVNLRTRSVEVYVLSEGEYNIVTEFVEDEVIESSILTGIGIITSSLFG